MDITNTNFTLNNYKGNYKIIRASTKKRLSFNEKINEELLDDAIIISESTMKKPDDILSNNALITDDTHIVLSNLNTDNITDIIKFCNKYGLFYSSLITQANKDDFSDIFTTEINNRFKVQEDNKSFDYMSLKTFILYTTITKAIYGIVTALRSLEKFEKLHKNKNFNPELLLKIGQNLIILFKIMGEKYYVLSRYYMFSSQTIFPNIALQFYSIYKSNFYDIYNENKKTLAIRYQPYFYDGMKNTFQPFYKFLNENKEENIAYSNLLSIIKLYKLQKTKDSKLLFNSQTLTNITLKTNYKDHFNFDKFKVSVYSIISDILNEENSKISPSLFYNIQDTKFSSKYSLKYLAQAITLEIFFALSSDDIIKKCAYEKCDNFFSVRNCRPDKQYCSDECKSNKNSHNYYFKKRRNNRNKQKNK